MTGLPIDIPVLQTDRLILRAPGAQDFESECRFYATGHAGFVGGIKRPDEVWRALASVLGHWVMRGYGMWSVEDRANGAYVGMVGPCYPHGWPEPEATGKGYAVKPPRHHYAYEVLDWDTAISLIALENQPSAAVPKRLSAQYEGIYTHPGYGDMHIWRHPSPADLEGSQ